MRATPIAIAMLLLAACGDAGAMLPDGGHADAAVPKSQRCGQCHMQDYLDATDPVHVGKKPPTCIVCHSQDAWHPHLRTPNHDWRLTGAHLHTDCLRCHTGARPTFEDLHDACIDCHEDDFETAGFPWHERFPKECDECHDTVDWGNATVESREPRWNDVHWDSGVPPEELPLLDAGVPEESDVDAGRRRPHRRDAGEIDIVGHATGG